MTTLHSTLAVAARVFVRALCSSPHLAPWRRQAGGACTPTKMANLQGSIKAAAQKQGATFVDSQLSCGATSVNAWSPGKYHQVRSLSFVPLLFGSSCRASHRVATDLHMACHTG